MSTSNTAVLPSLNARVASLGSFSGDLPSSSVDVSRAFLTAVYGIPGMPMLVKIAPGKNAPAGSPRHMILPRSDNNPGLPVRAGAPGTMLCNRSDVLENGPLALWVKVRAKENLWRYMGDYELRRAERPLSASEAQQFSRSVRRRNLHLYVSH
ncbi:hypothetical protein EWM64_g3210 [Hericium alpestre]|uniref:DUF6697 domain-containing protein n=1 Tax=Hericium alpestre TaxID=135208 RepID=A0A4Z0A3J0_9AGAM|nr:hypothetical protein EWM64_g3210 [Hericium alpestre]